MSNNDRPVARRTIVDRFVSKELYDRLYNHDPVFQLLLFFHRDEIGDETPNEFAIAKVTMGKAIWYEIHWVLPTAERVFHALHDTAYLYGNTYYTLQEAREACGRNIQPPNRTKKTKAEAWEEIKIAKQKAADDGVKYR